MARLESATPEGALTPREKIWTAMRRLREFDVRELAREAKVDRHKYRYSDYLCGLIKAGILVRPPLGKVGESVRYTLERDTGVMAPRVHKNGTLLPDSGRTRMWKAMPILRTFTARELAAAASLPEAPVAEREAATYCSWLCRGGYLAGVSGGWIILPSRRTGPKAPQILRVKELYDPNTDKIVHRRAPEGRDDL